VADLGRIYEFKVEGEMKRSRSWDEFKAELMQDAEFAWIYEGDGTRVSGCAAGDDLAVEARPLTRTTS
jgi:hypothetical protein